MPYSFVLGQILALSI